jgi:NADP-dependent 3-hydroxy acid dehydrogenase YdfG
LSHDFPVSKIVAITGASAGIGREVARQCAAAGMSVVINARRAELLAGLVAEIEGRGGEAVAVAGDVTVEADMRRLVAAAVDRFGRLDVMVCNAGIGYHGPLDDTPPDVMRRLVDVNLMGTLYAAAAALPVFRRQQRGHLIAVSSIAGRRGVGGSSVYGATKAAQIAMIESLRAEFLGTEIHASVVIPVGTRTEFHAAIARDFGYAVDGVGPRQSADDVARRIVACIRSPRAEIYPYRAAWWLSAISVLAPSLADRVVRRFGRHRRPRQPPGRAVGGLRTVEVASGRTQCLRLCVSHGRDAVQRSDAGSASQNC